MLGRDDLALFASMYACLWKDALERRSEAETEDILSRVKSMEFAKVAAKLAHDFGHAVCLAVTVRSMLKR